MCLPAASRGFSLLELLMTVTLAALVLVLGLPSLGELAADKRLQAESNALFHAVHLARKASIVRRRVVTLCPSSDGRACGDGSDWSRGWILFADADRDEPPQIDEGEDILMVHAVDERVLIEANRRAFSLRSTELRATNGTLVICDRAGRAEPRALVVSYTGRPRVARENSRGNDYRCMN